MINFIPKFALGKNHFQRHHISALIVVFHGAVFFDEGLDIGIPGLFQLDSILFCVICLAQICGRPNHDPQIVDNECVGYRAVVHGHIFHITARSQPVAQAGGDPKILFAKEAAHFADFTIHKGFHAIVIFPDIAVCSKLPIEHFRHNADAVTPAKHAHKAYSLHTGRCGNGGCDIALLVGGLRMADILQKLGPESFRMEVIGAG